MKTKLQLTITMALAVACSALLYINYKPRWSILITPNGEYGFVNCVGRVTSGYQTCDEAKSARDKEKKWYDYEAKKHGPMSKWFYWKKVENCD